MRNICIGSLIACIFLASCAVQSNNWKSNSQPGNFTASFGYFNGKEKYPVQLSKADALDVDYTVAATGGALTLSVMHGKETLWQKEVAAHSETASFHITAPEAGEYSIAVKGAKAAGSYEVKYKITPH